MARYTSRTFKLKHISLKENIVLPATALERVLINNRSLEAVSLSRRESMIPRRKMRVFVIIGISASGDDVPTPVSPPPTLQLYKGRSNGSLTRINQAADCRRAIRPLAVISLTDMSRHKGRARIRAGNFRTKKTAPLAIVMVMAGVTTPIVTVVGCAHPLKFKSTRRTTDPAIGGEGKKKESIDRLADNGDVTQRALLVTSNGHVVRDERDDERDDNSTTIVLRVLHVNVNPRCSRDTLSAGAPIDTLTPRSLSCSRGSYLAFA